MEFKVHSTRHDLSPLVFSILLYSTIFSSMSHALEGKTKHDAAIPDTSANQLPFWAATKNPNIDPYASNKRSVHVPSLSASQTCGVNGPVLLKDTNLMELLSNFDHERIPERVVHAKGGGAYGYFEVTHDLRDLTKASLFNKVGKRTEIFGRFSTAIGESGSADTARDSRGFAIKFYTDEGIFNYPGITHPVFQIRDPLFFPSLVHSAKRNPQTNLIDFNMFWDFASSRPETTMRNLFLVSDNGIPNGFQFVDSFFIHTLQLVNEYGQISFGRFHILHDATGKSFLTTQEGLQLAAINPDIHVKQLYDSIAAGNYPSWTVYVQPVTVEQAQNYKFNVFDTTKFLPVEDFPLRKIGKLVLNRNPGNFFKEVELSAFCPGDLVPGLEIAEMDALLHARSFSYRDTQRHRLGSNFEQLEVNRPHKSPKIPYSYERNGECVENNYDGGPNYFPNSYGGPGADPRATVTSVTGLVRRLDTGDEDNFSQPREYIESLSVDEYQRLVFNLALGLSLASDEKVRKRQLGIYSIVNTTFAAQLTGTVNYILANPSILQGGGGI